MVRFSLLPVLGVALLVACESTKPQARSSPTPAPPKVEQLIVENKGLEAALAKEQSARKTLEEQAAGCTLKLHEKETQIKDLRDRQADLQAKLDEAILEVVRAKGKLRSLESKAEAASNLAEAEIAIKSFEGQARVGEIGQELEQANQLLKMSAEEFKKENYGGALYLANEAKARMKSVGPRAASLGEPALAGESVFSVPLPLKVVRVCNLREGPGIDFKAVAALQKGANIVGLAQKGQWLRVKLDTGTAGWVYQKNVAPR